MRNIHINAAITLLLFFSTACHATSFSRTLETLKKGGGFEIIELLQSSDDMAVFVGYKNGSETLILNDLLTKDFIIDGEVFILSEDEKLIPSTHRSLLKANSMLIPKFVDEFGFVIDGDSNKTITLVVDYSCHYSKLFYKRILPLLQAKRVRVNVLPISRNIDKDVIYKLASLSCLIDKNKDKLVAFERAIKHDDISLMKGRADKKCAYWSDIKKYYSFFDLNGVSTVPAVFSEKNEYRPTNVKKSKLFEALDI